MADASHMTTAGSGRNPNWAQTMRFKWKQGQVLELAVRARPPLALVCLQWKPAAESRVRVRRSTTPAP